MGRGEGVSGSLAGHSCAHLLDHWPSTIGILAGFARAPVFRDSVIGHGSEILEKLLSCETKPGY